MLSAAKEVPNSSSLRKRRVKTDHFRGRDASQSRLWERVLQGCHISELGCEHSLIGRSGQGKSPQTDDIRAKCSKLAASAVMVCGLLESSSVILRSDKPTFSLALLETEK